MKTARKKAFVLSIVLLFIVILPAFGCAQAEKTTALEPTPTATAQPTPTPVAPTPVPTPTPDPSIYSIKDGYSPTTGLPWDGKYKPIAVIIENSAAARPQSGLSSADWVYEIYVEGKITRFLAIFNDHYPEKVGPIRSARVNFLDIQQQWHCALVHHGASEGGDITTCAKPRIPTLEFPFRVDALGPHSGTFWRDNERKAPHNSYNNLVKISEMFDADIQPVPHNFSNNVMQGGTVCNNLSIAYNDSTTFVEYKYDAEKNVYLRSCNHKPFTDKETGKQIAVTNIIIQRSDHTNPHVGRYTFEIYNMVGEGKAEYLIGGKYFKGTWKSDSIQDKTYFYLDNGEEITLLPGNTWVQEIYDDTEVVAGS